MPYTSATPRLFYRTQGEGPLVIMLHGLLMDSRCWVDNGCISALSPHFQVVCPDLPGHGASDKPDNQAAYTQQRQALAIVNLMDELGYEKAHIIGYSAGSWLAMELINAHADRLYSVVLGGWDCEAGLPETPVGKLTFEMFIAYARQVAPELTASLTPEDEKGAEHFFNELRKHAQDAEGFFPCPVPLRFWAGADDPYYAAMAALATRYDIPLFAGKGDHLSEVNHPASATLSAILNFVRNPQASGRA